MLAETLMYGCCSSPATTERFIEMPSTTVSVAEMKKLIKAELNVLLVGPSGVGKTLITREAVSSLGLKMKVLNAPTLDPYAHLIGIPVPNEETKGIDFRRPESIREAEVLFIDEANRASDPTLNALMELTQFRSINGEKLPNLRCVIAAMNPSDGDYKVNEIDLAMIDRFDAYFDLTPEIDAPYFTRKYGTGLGAATVKFWREYEVARLRQRSTANKVGYLSPRKMERILDNFIKSGLTSTSVPPNVSVTASSIRTTFGPFVRNGEIVDPNASRNSGRKLAPHRKGGVTAAAIRRHPSQALDYIAKNDGGADLDFIQGALTKSFSPTNFANSDWAKVLEAIGRDRCRNMYREWSQGKKNQLRESLDTTLFYSLFQ